MRDFFDQERPLSPALIKQVLAVFGLLLLGVAIVIVLSGLGTVFDGRLLSGLTQILGGLSLLLFMFIAARLLAELLVSIARLNDRLTILGDDLREKRTDTPESATSAVTEG